MSLYSLNPSFTPVLNLVDNLYVVQNLTGELRGFQTPPSPNLTSKQWESTIAPCAGHFITVKNWEESRCPAPLPTSSSTLYHSIPYFAMSRHGCWERYSSKPTVKILSQWVFYNPTPFSDTITPVHHLSWFKHIFLPRSVWDSYVTTHSPTFTPTIDLLTINHYWVKTTQGYIAKDFEGFSHWYEVRPSGNPAYWGNHAPLRFEHWESSYYYNPNTNLHYAMDIHGIWYSSSSLITRLNNPFIDAWDLSNSTKLPTPNPTSTIISVQDLLYCYNTQFQTGCNSIQYQFI